MSIRLKITILMICILTLVTIMSSVVGIVMVEQDIVKTMESDLELISRLANGVVSGEINLLNTHFEIDALRLEAAAGEQLADTLAELTDEHRYLSLAIVNPDGSVDSSGHYAPGGEFLESERAARALKGDAAIDTTEKIADDVLVMRLSRPLSGNRLLVATLPGLYFSRILDRLKFFDNGGIFVLDGEGVLMASSRKELVLNRASYLALAVSAPPDGKTAPGEDSISQVHARMIRGETGIAVYSLYGAKRICAYRPVSDSSSRWSVGVAVPLDDIPSYRVRPAFMFSMAAFWLLGVMISVVAGRIVAMPVEHLQERNRQLVEATGAVRTARLASESKTKFLSSMSHEIRTPLNAIIGYIEIILGGTEARGEIRENLENAYESSLTLLGLVNNILDISKIESGKIELAWAEYDLPSMINNLISLNTLKAADRPISFNLNIDENLPSRLVGDELRVKQVFSNLLSNAFKYTKEGSVEWSMTSERDGEYVWLLSTVRDTGIGIRDEDMHKLFQPYTQVDLKTHAAIYGTGLGLSIVMSLVKRMDGVISVASEYGKGSTFSVRIRQRRASDSRIGNAVAASLMNFRFPSRQRRHKTIIRAHIPYARVLVVDDVASNLEVSRGLMKPYGMRVDCVNSGMEAIRRISSGEPHYDAVFLDHMMPDLDGLETLRLIREIGTSYAKGVPIIALTANAVEGNKQFFAEHGFQDFLSKPLNIMWLDEVINRWVRDVSLEDKLRMGEDPPVAAEPDDSAERDTSAIFLLPAATLSSDTAIIRRGGVEGLDLSKGMVIFGGDSDSYLRSLRTFAKTTPDLLDQIRDAPTANLPRYTVIVHGIKGSSRNVGAEAVGATAEKLEMAARNGDIEFINANNGAFIRQIETMIQELSRMLALKESNQKKTRRDKPDPADLARLRDAIGRYDMDETDAAMEALEDFRYDNGAELIAWLRENVDGKNFREILERLA